MNYRVVASTLFGLMIFRGKDPAVRTRSLAILRRGSRQYPAEFEEARRIYWMCVFRDGGEVAEFDEVSYEETISWLEGQHDRTLRTVGKRLRRYPPYRQGGGLDQA
jgi:hypothetical protein